MLVVLLVLVGGMEVSGRIHKFQRPRRVSYDAAFKLRIVREALLLPPGNRIKPTCRAHPGIEPVQLRKWIRNVAALEEASPSSRCLGPAKSRRAPASPLSTEPSNMFTDCESKSALST